MLEPVAESGRTVLPDLLWSIHSDSMARHKAEGGGKEGCKENSGQQATPCPASARQHATPGSAKQQATPRSCIPKPAGRSPARRCSPELPGGGLELASPTRIPVLAARRTPRGTPAKPGGAAVTPPAAALVSASKIPTERRRTPLAEATHPNYI